jgi:hypothetical protein
MPAAEIEEIIPPTGEIFPWRVFVARHPTLFTEARVQWALRKRKENGLDEVRAVFFVRSGEWNIHEPRFLRWYLRLSGRRAPRRSRAAAGATPKSAVVATEACARE